MFSKAQKILGLVLLTAGLAIIVWGLYSSFQIFTAKVQPPEIFVLPLQEKMSPAKSSANSLLGGLMGVDIEKVMGSEIQKILPADYLPRLLNLLSWSVFSGILFFGGSQLAGLGIKLIK
ncbi:MAG: hypothetical protein Q8N65_00245 [bacterium]|nr:hypothetical protein [bacterium]